MKRDNGHMGGHQFLSSRRVIRTKLFKVHPDSLLQIDTSNIQVE